MYVEILGALCSCAAREVENTPIDRPIFITRGGRKIDQVNCLVGPSFAARVFSIRETAFVIIENDWATVVSFRVMPYGCCQNSLSRCNRDAIRRPTRNFNQSNVEMYLPFFFPFFNYT